MASTWRTSLERQCRLPLGRQGETHAGRLFGAICGLARAESPRVLWHQLLTAAMGLLEADLGHVQICNDSGILDLVCQCGFEEWPAETLSLLCGAGFNSMAIRQGRVVIGDTDRAGLGSDDGAEALRELGCRGVQAMPLVNPEGRIFGVLTTYSEASCTPTAAQLDALDDLALQAVCFAEHLGEREALVEAARQKDEFLATLAHELRNSLAPLHSSLEILKLGHVEPALQARACAILDRRLHSMTRLVEDLMNVSRIARGKLELRMERVPLASVLETAVETASPAMRELQHEFTVQMHDRSLEVKGDPVRLAQVLVNLLDNAAKYTPRGGRIRLETRAERQGACITVTDSGIGLAAATIPQLFQLFSQGAGGRGHRRGGLGIGLALAQRIVQMHGGSIEASSEGTGRGSVFEVWLPVADSTSTSPLPEGQSPTPLVNLFSLRVLVVDDSVDAADSLASLLTAHGHQARVAHDGLEAVAAAAEFQPDLILMDVVMPCLDGVQAAERIRQLPLPHQPEIIELTGEATAGDPGRESAAGIGGQLLKPISYSTLQQVVETTVDKVNALGAVSARFIIDSLELAHTVLASIEPSHDPGTREQQLQSVCASYERATAWAAGLSGQTPERARVENLLQSLEEQLAAHAPLRR